MTLREQIVEEMQTLPDNRLPEIFELIKKIQEDEEKPGLLRRLQKIRISDTPSDFSRNIDLYLNGEKTLD